METPRLPDSEAGLARVEPQSQEVFWPRENYHAPSTAPAEPTLLDFIRVLQKRKWVIVATVVVVVTLAAIASFRATPLYESTLRLAVYREGADIMGFQNMGSSSDDWDYTVALDTQARILQSDTLALKVIRTLELEKNPHFGGDRAAEPPAREAGMVPAAAQQMDIREEGQLLSIFRSSLRVSSVPKTRLIEIHYLSPDPRLSAEIANNLAAV
jgi:succinoglycan biosynthesis transport protein ExoP